jgi:hypothetical protein
MAGKSPVIVCALELEARAIRRALPGGTIVHTIGMQARRLPDIDPAGCSCIVLAGLAGALAPDLEVGAIVIDAPDGLLDCPQALAAPIHCAPGLVTTSAEKAELHRATGAAAVEMEGRLVRASAEQLGLPLVHIRAISDAAHEPVDPRVLSLVDPFGRARPLRIAAALARDPSLAKQLMRLNRQTRIALESLQRALREIVEQLTARE